MLYCPQCGAEYREGYSSCSDCHVLLVREPPHSYAQESVTEPGDPNKDPFTDFWKGDDARVHAELCSLLDEADIPHITIRKEDRLFNMARQPAFLIAVPFSGMEKAESVIREAFGGPLELAASGSEGSSVYEDGWTKFLRASAQKGLLPAILEKLREPRVPAEERRSKDLDDWFPEDATVEVWSGEDETLAEMISASLRENDIPSRTDEFKDSRLLLVQPQDEARAREIVREIVESSPPE